MAGHYRHHLKHPTIKITVSDSENEEATPYSLTSDEFTLQTTSETFKQLIERGKEVKVSHHTEEGAASWSQALETAHQLAHGDYLQDDPPCYSVDFKVKVDCYCIYRDFKFNTRLIEQTLSDIKATAKEWQNAPINSTMINKYLGDPSLTNDEDLVGALFDVMVDEMARRLHQDTSHSAVKGWLDECFEDLDSHRSEFEVHMYMILGATGGKSTAHTPKKPAKKVRPFLKKRKYTVPSDNDEDE